MADFWLHISPNGEGKTISILSGFFIRLIACAIDFLSGSAIITIPPPPPKGPDAPLSNPFKKNTPKEVDPDDLPHPRGKEPKKPKKKPPPAPPGAPKKKDKEEKEKEEKDQKDIVAEAAEVAKEDAEKKKKE